MKQKIVVGISLALGIFAVNAMAGTATEMCGKYPYNPEIQCCAGNKVYSHGWVKESGQTKQRCGSDSTVLGSSPDLIWKQ